MSQNLSLNILLEKFIHLQWNHSHILPKLKRRRLHLPALPPLEWCLALQSVLQSSQLQQREAPTKVVSFFEWIDVKDDVGNIIDIKAKYHIRCNSLLYYAWNTHLIQHRKFHNNGQGANMIFSNIFSLSLKHWIVSYFFLWCN